MTLLRKSREVENENGELKTVVAVQSASPLIRRFQNQMAAIVNDAEIFLRGGAVFFFLKMKTFMIFFRLTNLILRALRKYSKDPVLLKVSAPQANLSINRQKRNF